MKVQRRRGRDLNKKDPISASNALLRDYSTESARFLGGFFKADQLPTKTPRPLILIFTCLARSAKYSLALSTLWSRKKRSRQ
jgi:hypothetical protein